MGNAYSFLGENICVYPKNKSVFYCYSPDLNFCFFKERRKTLTMKMYSMFCTAVRLLN